MISYYYYLSSDTVSHPPEDTAGEPTSGSGTRKQAVGWKEQTGTARLPASAEIGTDPSLGKAPGGDRRRPCRGWGIARKKQTNRTEIFQAFPGAVVGKRRASPLPTFPARPGRSGPLLRLGASSRPMVARAVPKAYNGATRLRTTAQAPGIGGGTPPSGACLPFRCRLAAARLGPAAASPMCVEANGKPA